MYKVVAIFALICVAATRAQPVDMDELAEAPVAGVSQTSQTVVEQEPKITVPHESDVEMSEQNKEAMENAETFGFGYYKGFYPHPQVYYRSYPTYPLAYQAYGGYYGYPSYVVY